VRMDFEGRVGFNTILPYNSQIVFKMVIWDEGGQKIKEEEFKLDTKEEQWKDAYIPESPSEIILLIKIKNLG